MEDLQEMWELTEIYVEKALEFSISLIRTFEIHIHEEFTAS